MGRKKGREEGKKPSTGAFNLALKQSIMEMKARMEAEKKQAEAEAGKKRREEAEKAERERKEARARRRRDPREGIFGLSDAGLSDEALWASAVVGVTPLSGDIRGHAPPPPPREANVVSEDVEAMTQLSELVAGEGPFDLSSGDDFIEGHVQGLDPRTTRALKNGCYAIQGTLDLHGLSRSEAKPLVEKFLRESRRLSKRCVLVIHGKGLNSKDHIPVLKESLQLWLCQGAIGKSVLAFSTARPCDGGSGAVYVLLRR